MRRSLLVAALTMALLPTVMAYAQLPTCAAGERLSTDADIPNMTQLPVEMRRAGVCWNPNDTSIGAAVNEAKRYLKSMTRTGTAATDSNIDQLDSPYAVCAARFFREYRQRYPSDALTIRSAFRSAEYDAQMCRNNPDCGSLMNQPASRMNGNHQRGLAIDVASPNQQQLNLFAQQNPQLGLCFPFSLGGVTGTGRPDTVHLIPYGGPGNEWSGVGCRGGQRVCNVVGTSSPSGIRNVIPQVIAQASNIPTGAISNIIRGMITPPPPPYIPPQQVAPMYNPTQYFTPPPVVTPPPTAAPPPPISSLLPPPPPVSNSIVVTNPSTTQPVTATTTLINGINNVSALYDANGKPRPVGTTTVVVAAKPETTFVSNDLKNSPADPNAFKNRSALYTVLETMKQVLLKLRDLLRPFGARNPTIAR